MGPLNFRSLDLNLLRVFDEVMAERSLTRAALTPVAKALFFATLGDKLGDRVATYH